MPNDGQPDFHDEFDKSKERVVIIDLFAEAIMEEDVDAQEVLEWLERAM
jgi:hypothetical protein